MVAQLMIPDEDQIEALKVKHKIDILIADIYGKTVEQVEKEYDKRLVRLLQEWMRKRQTSN